jgi:hypothetical protein
LKTCLKDRPDVGGQVGQVFKHHVALADRAEVGRRVLANLEATLAKDVLAAAQEKRLGGQCRLLRLKKRHYVKISKTKLLRPVL